MANLHEKRRKRIKNDPEARAVYEAELSRIEAVDRVVNGLIDLMEQRRAELDISKAELARRVGANPASIRRLLTADGQNPQVSAIIALALELKIESLPVSIFANTASPGSSPQRSRAHRMSSAPPTAE